MSSDFKSGLKRIIFIGKKTVGKSSLIKSFLGDEKYTEENYETAKQIELSPYGLAVLVDTPNLDYNNEQSKREFDKTLGDLSADDFVIIVLDARYNLIQAEKNVFHYLKSKSISFLAAVNKIEHGINSELINVLRAMHIVHVEISCKENVGIDALKSHITRLLPTAHH